MIKQIVFLCVGLGVYAHSHAAQYSPEQQKLALELARKRTEEKKMDDRCVELDKPYEHPDYEKARKDYEKAQREYKCDPYNDRTERINELYRTSRQMDRIAWETGAVEAVRGSERACLEWKRGRRRCCVSNRLIQTIGAICTIAFAGSSFMMYLQHKKESGK